MELGVVERNRKAVVSSRDIARVFEKEHYHVMRDIRESNVSEKFRLSNFGESVYLNEQKHEMPEYLLTRDGFTIIAMGYNGEKAMRFKEAYIAAFDEMERRLSQPFSIESLVANPQLLLALLTKHIETEKENAVLTETVSVQTQQITEMQPKASYYDVVLSCKDALSITTIAKDYGKSAKWMNEKLHELGVQFKQGGIWHLYQKYAENGYTCTKTHNHPGSDGEIHAKNHTYWTQKGRFFLYELLKENGYVPLMERQLTAAPRLALV
jgi:Rha family phage regulatory protein